MLQEHDKTQFNLVEENIEFCWKRVADFFSEFQYNATESLHSVLSPYNDSVFNVVLRSDFAPEEVEAQVRQVVQEYAAAHKSFSWWIPESPIKIQLKDTLTSLGCQEAGEIVAMVADLTHWSAPETKHHLSVETITSVEEFPDWQKPIQTAFGMNELTAVHFREMFQRLFRYTSQVKHFFIKTDQQIVATATLVCSEKSAGIYNAATLPKYRGRGYLSALTQYLLQEARQLGYLKATLQASPMSYNVFKKRGFVPVMPIEVMVKQVTSS